MTIPALSDVPLDVVQLRERIRALEAENRLYRQQLGLTEDLTGQVYNGRTVIEPAGKGRKGYLWRVRCPEGHEAVLDKWSLKEYGCRECTWALAPGQHLIPGGSTFIDITGQRFGRWTVVCRAPSRLYKEHRRTYWHVRCECGHEAEVSRGNLQSGQSRGCRECSNRAARGPDGLHARRQRMIVAPDNFGAMKREIQHAFWASRAPGSAFIFVDGSVGEWQMLLERGFDPKLCATAALGQVRVFSERCNARKIALPGIRINRDITSSMRVRDRDVPVLQWLRSRLVFDTAHLDFCKSLDTVQPVIEAFLGAGLLAAGGTLAVTVSYRGKAWLGVMKALSAVVAPFGLTSIERPTPYRDTCPMLFSTFVNGQTK